MKKLLVSIIVLIILGSCAKKESYPRYSLMTIKYIPDSLKARHREWIKETIRASNQHLSAGDYENIDQTIVQAKWTADELFEVSLIGLRKEINEDYFDDLELTPDKMSTIELKILDSLKNKR